MLRKKMIDRREIEVHSANSVKKDITNISYHEPGLHPLASILPAERKLESRRVQPIDDKADMEGMLRGRRIKGVKKEKERGYPLNFDPQSSSTDKSALTGSKAQQ